MADEEFANAWEVCLSICSVSSCLSCVCDAVFLVWYVFVIGTLSYHNLVEVSRQAVVYVFCEKGFDARIKATEVAAKRVIVQNKSEGTRRKKTGLEIERSVFLKDYKDRKDLIKKAKFYPINVRDETTGRMKMIMVTRIFDQKEGVTAFEDYQDSGVESQNMLDNGQIILTEGQQDAAMDDAVAMINDEERGGGGAVSLTAADFGDAGPSSASGPSAPSPQKPAQPNPAEPQNTEAISSDEEDTPAEKSLRTHRQLVAALHQSTLRSASAANGALRYVFVNVVVQERWS